MIKSRIVIIKKKRSGRCANRYSAVIGNICQMATELVNKNGFQLDGCFESWKICDECAFGGFDRLGRKEWMIWNYLPIRYVTCNLYQ